MVKEMLEMLIVEKKRMKIPDEDEKLDGVC